MKTPYKPRWAAALLPLLAAIAAGAALADTPAQQSAGDAQVVSHGRGYGSRWGVAPGLRIAGRLATLQVYLGITPEQQDAWRNFTQAALAMIPGPSEMRRDITGDAFEGIDRMTERMQRRAAAAQTLDQAAQSLKAVLTPDQVQKADGALTTLWATREHRRHDWTRSQKDG